MKFHYLFFTAGLPLLSACYSPSVADEEVITSTEKQSVTIITRATSSSALQYPIQIYAIDARGVEKAHQTLSDASESLKLALAQGEYKIVAYSGSLAMPAEGYSTTPLMLGAADVVVGGQPLTVSLLLSYQVSSVDVSLANIPAGATSVELTLSPQYRQLALDGTFCDAGMAHVPFSLADGVWSTGTFYVMPGSGQQTSFSIAVSTPSGQQTYGYTYVSPLKAATPYHLSGVYLPGATEISGILSSGEWGSAVDISFSFGEGASDSFDGGTADQPTVTPDAGTIALQDHVIAYADTTATAITYTLISLADYAQVHSASSSQSSEAATLAAAYNEAGLTGWRIPTEEEAKRLKSLYVGAALTTLNGQITAAGGSNILVLDAKGESYRYLCANATKTFQFKSSTSVTAAGATITYGLRLVRTVKVDR